MMDDIHFLAGPFRHGVNQLLMLGLRRDYPAAREVPWHTCVEPVIRVRAVNLFDVVSSIQQMEVEADQVGSILRWK